MFSVNYSSQANIDLESAISHIAEESVSNALINLINNQQYSFIDI